MKQLYIRQKIWSLTDRYQVFDHDQIPVYTVESEFLTFLPKFHIYDQNGREVFYIRKKMTFFLAEYEIYKNSILCASVHQEMAFFSKKISIESTYGNFEIDGDLFGWDFTITCNGIPLGSISKKLLAWGDTYELAVNRDEDVEFFCTLVVAIDNCIHNEN